MNARGPAAGSVIATEALARVADPAAPRSQELFRHGTFRVKVYAPRRPFAPGDFLFVAAGREHRFEDFTDDFATWVLFYGPEGGEHG